MITKTGFARAAVAMTAAMTLAFSGGVAAAAAPATKPSPSKAKTAMAKAVLRRTDLPAGWIKSTSDNSDPGVGNKQLAACLGVSKRVVDRKSTHVKRQFSAPSAGVIQTTSNEIAVANPGDAKVFGAISKPTAPGCLNNILAVSLKKELGTTPGLTLTGPTTTNVDVGSYLDHTVAFHVAVSLTKTDATPAVQAPVGIDLVFVTDGTYIADFLFASTGAPIDATLEHKVLTTVTDRMKSLPS